jgi:CheY-like chemotaxis protein
MTLQRFKANYFDLLILDIKMPKMNGFDVDIELKKRDRRIKVCFLTAPQRIGGLR